MTSGLLSDPPASDTRKPVSTTASSILMQDRVSADRLSIAWGNDGSNTVALFANPFLDGKEEALIVNEQGQLTYLRRTDTDLGRSGTETGWRQETLPGPSGDPITASEVVVVIHHRDLSVWALFTDHGAHWGDNPIPVKALRLTPKPQGGTTSWSWQYASNALPNPGWLHGDPPQWDIHALSVNYEARKPWVFGVDPHYGNLIWIEAVLSATQGQYFALAKRDDNLNSVGRIAAAYSQGKSVTAYYSALPDGNLYANGPAKVGVIASSPVDLAGVYNIPTAVSTPASTYPGCVFLWNGNLYTYHWYVDGGGTPHEIARTTPGLGFATATLWVDGNGMMHVFGLTDNGTLQVVHQAAWDDQGVPVWSQAQAKDGTSTPVFVGVHPDVMPLRYAVDPFPDYLPTELIEVQGVQACEQYRLCSQDINTTRWSVEKVRLPETGQQYMVKNYVSEVTLLDAIDAPVPNHPVRVSAESLVEIRHEGASYLVGPGHSATLTTNGLGKVVVSIDANTLIPPPLHVDAVGLEHGAVVQPAADVHDYLAGTGTLPSQKGKFDKNALLTAQDDTGASILSPSLDPTKRDAAVGHAVDGIHNVFKVANGQQLASRLYRGPGPAPAIHGFALRKGPDGTISYHEFATAAEADAHRELIRSADNYGGIWEDFVNFASDLWEGLKNGVVQITEVVVDAVVTICVKIGEAVVELAQFVIRGIESAVHAAEAVIRLVVDAIGKVIDWLKALFNFRDILDTKTAIQGVIDQTPQYVTFYAHKVKGLSADWFTQQRGQVEKAFTELRSTYADTRLGDFKNKTPAVPGLDPNGNPQANWLTNQLTASQGQAALTAASGTITLPDEIFNAFERLWNQAGAGQPGRTPGDHLLAALNAIKDAVTAFFSDPSGGAKKALVELLNAVEQLILAFLTFLDQLASAGADLLIAAADTLADFLNQKYDLGPLNWVWDWIHETAGIENPPRMTLGGLFSLISAFPATIIYKLFAGVDNPPFPGGKFPVLPRPGTALVAAADPDPNLSANSMTIMELISNIPLTIAAVFQVVSDLPNVTVYPSVMNTMQGLFGTLLQCPAAYTQGPPSGGVSAFWGAWLASLAGYVGSIVTLTAGSRIDPTSQPGPFKSFNTVTSAFTSLLGVCGLVTGAIACSQEGAPPLIWASTITNPLPNATAFVFPILKGLKDPETKFIVTGIKAGFDTFAGGSSVLAGMVANGLALRGIEDISNSPPDTGAKVGVWYTYDYPVRTYYPPVTWTLKPEPAAPWLTVVTGQDKQTGRVSGVPAAKGQFKITLTGTNNWYPPFSTTKGWTITVADCPATALSKQDGDGQSAAVNTTFAKRLVVKLTSGTTPVSGVIVVFASPPAGPSGTFSTITNDPPGTTATAMSDGNGLATAPDFTANGNPGDYTVTAAVAGTSLNARFTLRNQSPRSEDRG